MNLKYYFNLNSLILLVIFVISSQLQAQHFMSVIGDRPDPHILYYDGYYYYTGTFGGSVSVKRSETLDGLRNAGTKRLFDANAGGPPGDYWASEIHRVNGNWYIYYTADPTTISGTDNQRMYVIENTAEDPYTGTWTNHRIFDPNNDVWAIDGTVFEHNGELYYVWSGSDVHDNIPHKPQNIYIARMSNPWTLETGRVLLSTPTSSWEGNQVDEGPEVVKHGNRIFIAFSSHGCWTPDYRIGGIYMNVNSDPLNPAAWTKHPTPFFSRYDLFDVYGPGHHCFFKSPDGTEDWFAYHAVADPAGGCNSKRTVRAQRFYWSADNIPVFGQPIKQGEVQVAPLGEVEVATESPIENGIYELKVKSSSGIALDLENCNLDVGANARMWTDLNNQCQRWFVQAVGNGTYTITSYENGLSLDVQGCSSAEDVNIQTYKPNGSSCGQWEIIEVELGYYKVESKSTGKVLHILGGTQAGDNLVQRTYSGQENEKWSFKRTDDDFIKDGVYVITSQKSGKAMQLDGCATGNSVKIVQGTVTKDDCQQWEVKKTDDGFYSIISVLSGKSMDMPTCSTRPGTKFQTWDYLDNSCQKFRIIPYGVNGAYKIFQKKTNMALDVSNCSSSDGAEIQQWPYKGIDCQLWELQLLTVTDVNEDSGITEVSIHPNPVTEILHIKSNTEFTQYKIIDVSGRVVKEVTNPNSEIDVSGLPKGVYYLELLSKDGAVVRRFLKE